MTLPLALQKVLDSLDRKRVGRPHLSFLVKRKSQNLSAAYPDLLHVLTYYYP